MNYTLKYGEQVYIFDEDHSEGVFNDDLMPINAIDHGIVSNWLVHMPNDGFELEYFEDDCEVCPPKPRGKKKLVPYLEGHFYVFTKKGEPVITSIDPSFVQGSYDELLALGKVDQSYILSVIVCPVCGSYQFSLEQVDM